jgi:drug/metabolite transporter (DMT)-like permease
MPPAAFALILAAAVAHAGWNLAAKRAQHSGPALLWWSNAVSVALYAPLAWIFRQALTPTLVAVVATSSMIHLGYFVLLQRGYATGDLSVVYPLARGTGPLLSVTIAVLFLHERPGLPALLGAATVIGGIAVITAGGLGGTATLLPLR